MDFGICRAPGTNSPWTLRDHCNSHTNGWGERKGDSGGVSGLLFVMARLHISYMSNANQKIPAFEPNCQVPHLEGGSQSKATPAPQRPKGLVEDDSNFIVFLGDGSTGDLQLGHAKLAFHFIPLIPLSPPAFLSLLSPTMLSSVMYLTDIPSSLQDGKEIWST